MALLPILEYPDERLRTVAKPIDHIDDALQRLIDDMFETMYEAPGVGLAATQINFHRQLIVIDVSEEKNTPLVLINPRIVESEGTETCQEGCLSVPGIFADVVRAERIVVELRDRVSDLGAGAALGLAGGSIAGDPKSEAVAALQQLGYKPAEASRMAQKVAEDGDDAETIIRKALKSALKT